MGIDTLYFPVSGTSLALGEELLIDGTDIMQLFNCFIPGIDPLFQGNVEDSLLPESNNRRSA